MTVVTSPTGRLFTAREAASYLGVRESKVRRMIARGDVPVLRHPGGRLEGIYEADLDAWRARRHPDTPVAATVARADVDRQVEALLDEGDDVFA